MTRSEASALNAKELQRVECLAKAIGALLKDIYNNSNISNETKTPADYIRMRYISHGSVCDLETQIVLAGDLGFIENKPLNP